MLVRSRSAVLIAALAVASTAGADPGALLADSFETSEALLELGTAPLSGLTQRRVQPFDPLRTLPMPDPAVRIRVDKRDGFNARLTTPGRSLVKGEVHIEYQSKYEVGQLGTRALAHRGWGVTTNWRGYVRDRRLHGLEPFVLTSVGLYQDRERSSDPAKWIHKSEHTAMRVGGGFDFFATRRIAVSAVGAYVLPAGGLASEGGFALGCGIRADF